MLRLFSTVARAIRPIQIVEQTQKIIKPAIVTGNLRQFSCYTGIFNSLMRPQFSLTKSPLLENLLPTSGLVLQQQPSRTVTKFSLKKGKRKTVKAVVKRFKRLDWGAWIRTRCGRHKKMWRKSVALKKRLREHVFVNGQQSTLLDKMVTSFWRRPKYYIDDPYTPYHTRNEFPITRRPSEKF